MADASDIRVREIGIPVRGVNWVRLFAGRDGDGRDCLYATMGQESAPLFVLQIDPRDGALRQFGADVADAHFAPASCMAPDGRLYIGAAYAGHLLRFDPRAPGIVDLGQIHPEKATFPCRIDVAPDGGIWVGSYPSADLTRYDPETGRFARYGSVDDVDMYNYPWVNTDGTVACLVRVTRAFVVVVEPESGIRRPVGPVAVQGQDTLDLFRGDDGALYIDSSLGNYLLRGFDAIPVDEVPRRQPAPPLSDGTTFAFADAPQQSYRQLRLRAADGRKRTYELDYEAGGSRLFLIHQGPDARIYGSSVMPLHLFRWDPNTDALDDLGRCSQSTGEAYSMANLDGRMFIASYPQAILSVYDPARPYRFGDDTDANPRHLGRIDDLSYRPRAMVAGPLGRVWTASVPDYGRWGGPLACYDPATGERRVFADVAGDGSCYTLAWLEALGLFAVGLTVEGGTGTKPKLDTAGLLLWDPATEATVWASRLPGVDDVHAVNALVVGADGALYGTARRHAEDQSALFRFDAGTRTFTDCIPLPEFGLDLGLQPAPDGTLYGFTLKCLYRVEATPLSIVELLRDDDEGFRTAGPVIETPAGGLSALFARTHRLMIADLP